MNNVYLPSNMSKKLKSYYIIVTDSSIAQERVNDLLSGNNYYVELTFYTD